MWQGTLNVWIILFLHSFVAFVDLNNIISQQPSWPSCHVIMPCPTPLEEILFIQHHRIKTNTGFCSITGAVLHKKQIHTVIKNDLAVHIGTEYLFMSFRVWGEMTQTERGSILYLCWESFPFVNLIQAVFIMHKDIAKGNFNLSAFIGKQKC